MSVIRIVASVLVFAAFVMPCIASAAAYNQGGYYSQPSYYSQPAYYSQPYYQGSYNTTFTKNTYVRRNFFVTGSISKGSGTFVIDHPLDPKNSLLYHSFVESPDALDLYDGTAEIGRDGSVAIELPSYFMALNEEFQYQVKPLDAPMPNLHVVSEVDHNRFVVGGGEPGKRITWQVTGVRHDPYIVANPIVVEVEKGDDTLVNPGVYFHSDVSYGIRDLFLWIRTLIYGKKNQPQPSAFSLED